MVLTKDAAWAGVIVLRSVIIIILIGVPNWDLGERRSASVPNLRSRLTGAKHASRRRLAAGVVVLDDNRRGLNPIHGRRKTHRRPRYSLSHTATCCCCRGESGPFAGFQLEVRGMPSSYS